MGVKGPEVAWAQEWLLRVVTGSGYCRYGGRAAVSTVSAMNVEDATVEDVSSCMNVNFFGAICVVKAPPRRRPRDRLVERRRVDRAALLRGINRPQTL